MQLFTNNADSELNGAIDALATSLTLKTDSGNKFPSPVGGDFFLITLYQKVGATEVNHEILKCTARTGDVLTVVRAQESTEARAFSNTDAVELRVTAGSLASKADVASAYTHPTSHLPSIITQDASNRFVTDTEKATWNAKQAAGTYATGTGSASGVNTGDQVLPVAASTTPAPLGTAAIGVGTSFARADHAHLQPTLATLGAQPAGTYATGTGTASGTNTGDQDLSALVTLAGTQTLTNKTITATVFRETKIAISSVLDVTAGNLMTRTVTANTTFVFSAGVPAAGIVFSFILDLTNGGTFTITWPTAIKWAGGTAPTLTAAGRDMLGFVTHDGGTIWSGLVLGRDVK